MTGTERCERCEYWEHKVAKWGRCVVNPPVAYYDDEGCECCMWPQTSADERCGRFKESRTEDPQPCVAVNNAEQEKQGEMNMFEKMFNFNGLFGKLGPGMCRLSANGGIAVKTSHGYKTYNVKSGKLVNCSSFCLDMGDEWFFSIPTNKVAVGNIILVNGTPRCVIEVKRNSLTVMNYENNTIEQIVPERHIFMGNVYFYGRIMSPFGHMFGKKGGMKNIMQLMVLSKMFGGGMPGAAGSQAGGQLGNMGGLMMLGMMGGGDNIFSNMFEGMFDEADSDIGLLNADADDDDDEVDTSKDDGKGGDE